MDHGNLLNPPGQFGARACYAGRLLFVAGNDDQHFRPAHMLKFIMLTASDLDLSVYSKPRDDLACLEFECRHAAPRCV